MFRFWRFGNNDWSPGYSASHGFLELQASLMLSPLSSSEFIIYEA